MLDASSIPFSNPPETLMARHPFPVHRLATLVLVTCLAGGAPASAAPVYTLVLNSDYQNAWSVPTRLDTTAHTVASGSMGTVASTQYATLGGVGASVSAVTSLTGFSGGDNFSAWPRASTDDFVIDGSGSYVTGTLYLRFRAHVGGSGGESGCRADVMPWITIGGNVWNGGFRATNLAGYPPYQAWGMLAGARPVGDIDTVLAITKTWPVGAPFSIELGVIVDALTSVDAAHQMADWWANGGGLASGPGAGLALGDANGLVMGLPQYFALRSASWHIANSLRDGIAGVGDGPPARAGLALAGARPNPARADGVSLVFSLPDDAPAALELFDLAGRRVASRDVGVLGAGEHVVELAARRPLSPGLYLARLTRGGDRRTARVIVTE
jgi:hypothetical protein